MWYPDLVLPHSYPTSPLKWPIRSRLFHAFEIWSKNELIFLIIIDFNFSNKILIKIEINIFQPRFSFVVRNVCGELNDGFQKHETCQASVPHLVLPLYPPAKPIKMLQMLPIWIHELKILKTISTKIMKTISTKIKLSSFKCSINYAKTDEWMAY